MAYTQMGSSQIPNPIGNLLVQFLAWDKNPANPFNLQTVSLREGEDYKKEAQRVWSLKDTS